MHRLFRPCRNQNGMTFMVVLIAVFIVGLSAGITGTTWKTVREREKEEQLLWCGDQVRRAIGGYYRAVVPNVYPESIKALASDSRSAGVQKHLRASCGLDPMTGKDWVTIPPDPPQGKSFRGVRSSSEKEGFRASNFMPGYAPVTAVYDFGGSAYAKWEFIFEPGQEAHKEAPSTREDAVRSIFENLLQSRPTTK